MERELIKHLIQQVKQQQRDRKWHKNNFITIEQFFKPYTIKPQKEAREVSYAGLTTDIHNPMDI